MKDIREKSVFTVNGLIMAAVDLAVFFFCARHFVTHVDRAGSTAGDDRRRLRGASSSS